MDQSSLCIELETKQSVLRVVLDSQKKCIFLFYFQGRKKNVVSWEQNQANLTSGFLPKHFVWRSMNNFLFLDSDSLRDTGTTEETTLTANNQNKKLFRGMAGPNVSFHNL